MANKKLRKFSQKRLTEKQVSVIYRAAKCKYNSSYAMMVDDAFAGAESAAKKHGIWVCYDSPWFSMMFRNIRAHNRWEHISEWDRQAIVDEINGGPENVFDHDDAGKIFDTVVENLWYDCEDDEKPAESGVYYRLRAADGVDDIDVLVSDQIKTTNERWFSTFRKAAMENKQWEQLPEKTKTTIFNGLKKYCSRAAVL
jgi:hypothetical protein